MCIHNYCEARAKTLAINDNFNVLDYWVLHCITWSIHISSPCSTSVKFVNILTFHIVDIYKYLFKVLN